MKTFVLLCFRNGTRIFEEAKKDVDYENISGLAFKMSCKANNEQEAKEIFTNKIDDVLKFLLKDEE